MWKKGSTAMMVSRSPKPSQFCMPWHWQRLATRLRWVSITPLGIPVVPLEYGSATRSSRGSMRTVGGPPPPWRRSAKGVAPSAVPKTKISSTALLLAASFALSRNGLTVTRKRARVRELLGELIRGGERIGGGVDAAQPGHGEEDHRVLRHVRAVDREDVALLEAAPGEAGGSLLHAVGELAIGQGPSRRAVDEGGLVAEALGMTQNELRDRHVGNRHVGAAALHDHRGLLGGQSVSRIATVSRDLPSDGTKTGDRQSCALPRPRRCALRATAERRDGDRRAETLQQPGAGESQAEGTPAVRRVERRRGGVHTEWAAPAVPSRTASRHSRFSGRMGGMGTTVGSGVAGATASLRSVAAPFFMN